MRYTLEGIKVILMWTIGRRRTKKKLTMKDKKRQSPKGREIVGF